MKKAHIIEILIFLILISILGFYGLKAFKHTFDIGTIYHVEFKDIDSIVVGSPVRILGVDVGHVTKIQNDIDKIYIDFVINDDRIKLPDGTKATIEFFGIAGSRSIELTPPTKTSDAEGIVISEPIRIGDAFDIMQNFMEASMKTLTGLSEFAKNRSQKDVEQITNNILSTTQIADDKIIDLTSTISKGGAKLHKSFEGTTKGFSRVYNETEALNISENFNISKYSFNLAKRTLIQFHRNIKKFNQQFGDYTKIIKITDNAIQTTKKVTNQINQAQKSIENLNNSLKQIDGNFTKENLNNAHKKIEDIKNLSENLEKEI